MAKFKLQRPLTERGFEKLLTKASQPLSELDKLDSKVKRTSGTRLSDGYIGKRKSQDKIEDTKDLPND